MLHRLMLVACLALRVAGAAECGGHGTVASMLVSTAWLATHLTDPNLVILAIGPKEEYDAAHIPGSILLDPATIRQKVDEQHPLQLELPPMAQLTDAFGKLGISNQSRVVLYMTKDWNSPTTRVFLTLDAMGLGPHASVLDGGLPVWQKEGRAVTKDVPTPRSAQLKACPQDDVIAGLDYVRTHLQPNGVRIVDARLPEFYTGAQAGRNKRPGHIPGSANIPFSSLVDTEGKLLPDETLRARFEAAGVKAGDRVVSYCHIGQQATMVYFAARYLGYDARMYDGSWDEWSNHTELPAELAK